MELAKKDYGFVTVPLLLNSTLSNNSFPTTVRADDSHISKSYLIFKSNFLCTINKYFFLQMNVVVERQDCLRKNERLSKRYCCFHRTLIIVNIV